ncbi:MAG: glycosyltransferase family 2 protein [Thermoplasmatota archaeon]
MLVSVVVVNWNRREDLLRALGSLRAQTHKELEIIVVDNCSSDGSQAAVREGFPEARLIEMPHSGFSACHTFNLGMMAARGELVAVMDNDATIEREWVERAVRHFEERPDVGAIASKIVNVYKEHFYFQYESWPDYSNEEEYDIYTFRGCAFAIRTDLLRRIGYFPEEYEIYVNEDDLAARVWASGHRIRHYSDLVARHYTSRVQRPGWRMVYYTTRNRVWNYIRYLSPSMALLHTLWALWVEGPMIVGAGQTRHLLRGLWHGFRELPRLGDRRRYVPDWERVMWRNEREGMRRRRGQRAMARERRAGPAGEGPGGSDSVEDAKAGEGETRGADIK